MAYSHKQFIFLSFYLISWSSIGSAKSGVTKKNDCKKLIQELHVMKKTQNEIIQSLASNHATMADSQEEISNLIQLIPPDASDEVADKLKNTGKAFRLKGLQAMKTAESMDRLTDELIQKTESCLQQNSSRGI